MLLLVTGEIGTGKTSACRRALDLLCARGITSRGILTPPRLDAQGLKTGIDVLDVATGERKGLANWAPGETDAWPGETVGDYRFYPHSLAWAKTRLREAIARPGQAGENGLLVVDEIGPLELIKQKGLVEFLTPLAQIEVVPQALVIVRWAYVDALERLLARPDTRRFIVDIETREHMPERIAEYYLTRARPQRA